MEESKFKLQIEQAKEELTWECFFIPVVSFIYNKKEFKSISTPINKSDDRILNFIKQIMKEKDIRIAVVGQAYSPDEITSIHKMKQITSSTLIIMDSCDDDNIFIHSTTGKFINYPAPKVKIPSFEQDILYPIISFLPVFVSGPHMKVEKAFINMDDYFADDNEKHTEMFFKSINGTLSELYGVSAISFPFIMIDQIDECIDSILNVLETTVKNQKKETAKKTMPNDIDVA